MLSVMWFFFDWFVSFAYIFIFPCWIDCLVGKEDVFVFREISLLDLNQFLSNEFSVKTTFWSFYWEIYWFPMTIFDQPSFFFELTVWPESTPEASRRWISQINKPFVPFDRYMTGTEMRNGTETRKWGWENWNLTFYHTEKIWKFVGKLFRALLFLKALYFFQELYNYWDILIVILIQK